MMVYYLNFVSRFFLYLIWEQHSYVYKGAGNWHKIEMRENKKEIIPVSVKKKRGKMME
jgi:hypothetical protein